MFDNFVVLMWQQYKGPFLFNTKIGAFLIYFFNIFSIKHSIRFSGISLGADLGFGTLD